MDETGEVGRETNDASPVVMTALAVVTTDTEAVVEVSDAETKRYHCH